MESARKEYVLDVYIPEQKRFRVYIQEQSDVLGYDFRCSYRFGINIELIDWACGGMIASRHVD